MTRAEQRNGLRALYCWASMIVANWVALDIGRPSREARESISITKISGFWFRHAEVRILVRSPLLGCPAYREL